MAKSHFQRARQYQRVPSLLPRRAPVPTGSIYTPLECARAYGHLPHPQRMPVTTGTSRTEFPWNFTKSKAHGLYGTPVPTGARAQVQRAHQSSRALDSHASTNGSQETNILQDGKPTAPNSKEGSSATWWATAPATPNGASYCQRHGCNCGNGTHHKGNGNCRRRPGQQRPRRRTAERTPNSKDNGASHDNKLVTNGRE